ncbi:MAG: methyltransferase domain-containing protein [Elusimicrobiota bacterium]
MMELTQDLILHGPDWHAFQRGDVHLWLDPDRPHWAATDERGAWILGRADGRTPFGRLADEYRTRYGLAPAKAWLELHEFLRDALRHDLLRASPFPKQTYPGRDRYLTPESLRELWLHLLQTCNLSCRHCLVSSGPKGAKGADTGFYRDVMGQAVELGTHRFYFTGGEPLIRPDFPELAKSATGAKDAELIVLTNATLLTGERLAALDSLDRGKVRFQVSLDGATPEVNDAIRGGGGFESACKGLKALVERGFETSLTTVVAQSNMRDLEAMPELVRDLGAGSLHLMWLHKRGRAAEADFPTGLELVDLYRTVRDRAAGLGVRLDNEEAFRQRLRGQPGVKYDLSNACWESLCLYHDGTVYPTAATAGQDALCLGSAKESKLRSLWLDSPVARDWRSRSLARMASSADPFRFLTGGGDVEHAHYFSNGVSDPHHPLYVEAIKDAMEAIARSRAEAFNRRTGYSAPVVWYAMGTEQLACEAPGKTKEWLEVDAPVRTLHSNCVLAFDVHKPYRVLQEFYGGAAEEPRKELCCPVKYDPADTGHIPGEVLDRFYGCGSPVGQAGLIEGETFVDLGSGGGIDCFIAAKKVGPEGKVIGVDMTDAMLEVARRSAPVVARNLGYDVAEFRKGFLERIPVEDESADCVSSNCVLNLSPDKPKVFGEIWRILKDHGRICVADIVSDRRVPAALQADERLWGECLTGALSEEEFLAELERAGFYGLRVLKRTFWKEVRGHRFHSVTVSAHKYAKRSVCRFTGQKAVYLGPWKSVMDEEGHLFCRNEPVEVCIGAAAKLLAGPYGGMFRVLEPDGRERTADAPAEPVAASADGGCCAGGKGGSCC